LVEGGLKMEEQVERLSEIITGWPKGVRRSFYSDRIYGITAAYNYLEKKLSDKRESHRADLALKFVWGFILGILFSLVMLVGDVFFSTIKGLLH
jgi:hypothetical protein